MIHSVVGVFSQTFSMPSRVSESPEYKPNPNPIPIHKPSPTDPTVTETLFESYYFVVFAV